MDRIIEIVYIDSYNNKILSIEKIEKILELLVSQKELENYIYNMSVCDTNLDVLGSYSYDLKSITLFKNRINSMINFIDNMVVNLSDFEVMLYKNLRILQSLLHEVEHAYQYKISFVQNSLEAFILRLSYMVDNRYDGKLYELCPEERLAEIKSYYEIEEYLRYLDDNIGDINNIIKNKRWEKLFMGYHVRDTKINTPIIEFLNIGGRSDLIEVLDFKLDMPLEERLKYGFPISDLEYRIPMRQIVYSLKNNFRNYKELVL